ncbi:MAG: hypothetical protein IPG85_04010 [Bacteroidetes bacterium]|nr:hypothetical protein [Bacteroidota bacterium]
MNNFENYLIENNNTTILKFYPFSHEEQLSRLQERIQIPEKMWKYNETISKNLNFGISI